MDYTKEALSYLMEEKAGPCIEEVNGIMFSDKPLYEVPNERKPVDRPVPGALKVHTLRGLVSLLKADECRKWGRLYVIVSDPRNVAVVTDPMENAKRASLFSADAIVPAIAYEKFIDKEAMLIMLRSRFVPTQDAAALLSLIGNVKESAVKENNDDGVSQTVTAKVGIAVVKDTTVNPIQLLAPYRTFVEVDQPKSEFLFRMQSSRGDGGPTMALFEADGGQWQLEAMKNVAEYLEDWLSGVPNVTVIQ